VRGELTLLALFLALLALAAWLWVRRQYHRIGLPPGRLVYADTGTWKRVEQPLFSAQFQLTGKPDYLVEESSYLIPVELKSSACPSTPYASHRLQLAAYCLLVGETYGQAPPYGLLKYRDATVAVDYSPTLRSALLAVLQAMRQDYGAPQVSRNHDSAGRCRACGLRSCCGQALL
jgi:CRISPR-associated exonuclease Cas4